MTSVEFVTLVPLADDQSGLGLLASLVVRVGGIHVGPILVLRASPGSLHVVYAVSFDQMVLPECLLDDEIRTEIRAMAEHLFEQAEQGQ